MSFNPERLTVMRKVYIALAVLATATLSSCVHEQSFNDVPLVSKDAVAFVMKGVSTRSGEAAVSKGVTIPAGKTPRGESIYLEETITELSGFTPATKGAPAYTENVGELYKEDLTVHTNYSEFYDTAFERVSDELVNGGWSYAYKYTNTPWPDGKVDFYLRMPISGNGVTDLSYNDTDKKVTFTLNTPATAAQQQDLLFGFTSLTEEEHESYRNQGGAPVLMYHALTGVKFANGHPNDNSTKTIISKVEFIGLKDNGTCVFNPADGTYEWTSQGIRGTADAPFIISQGFSNPDYTPADGASNSDGTVDFTDPSAALQLPGTTWTEAAASHNLNESDGSLTFWFIPQTVSNDVKLNVTFFIKTPDTPNGTEIVRTIDFGTLVNSKGQVEWKAGQLRTYTLKPYDVDVEILDAMTSTIKSDLRIANTGNVDEYVRVLIMGNWYGWKPGTTAAEMQTTEPSILVGYKYQGNESGLTEAQKNEMVEPWYRGGYPNPNNPTTYYDPYGHFDDSFPLAKLDERDGKCNDWADASGGFYYTMPIGPGAKIPGTNSATKDLFKTYTVTNVPDIYLPSGGGRAKAEGVHLVMEIVVQAIEVPKVIVDGEEKSVWWLEAWYQATGVSKLHPNSIKDGEYRNKKYRDLFLEGEYAPTVAGEIPIE